jgi:hypothetical protein
MTTPATQQAAQDAAYEILGYYLLPRQAMVPSIIQRAIDSEVARACAERDQQIARLQAQLAEARKDSMRLNQLMDIINENLGTDTIWQALPIHSVQDTLDDIPEARVTRAAIDAASTGKDASK